MPRKNLIRTNLHPYHITIRSNNREWFDIPLNEVWDICLTSLKKANTAYPVKIQAFVLMSNHYHLMVWTPNNNIDKFMFILNSGISKLIREKTGRITRIFGDRYKWSLITDQRYYLVCLRYIYQNPLCVNVVKKCEQYPYSTLYYVFNNKKLSFSLFEPIPSDKENFINWVNQKATNNESIKKGLQKPKFKIPTTRTSRRIT